MLVEVKHPVPSDIEIAQEAKMRPIMEVAAELGLDEDDLDLYGKYKAKVHLDVAAKFADRPQGKYIDVTAITPTPLGEGKTVTTIGVSQGLHYIGKKVMTCIRQPSQGPTFGIKGGAAGGGYSQIVPMEDFNLHLTGDIHAVGAAHNLLAAAIDNRLAKEARWSTDYLAKALCPKDEYTPSMRKRLEKLGIESEKPSDLSDDDKERMFRLNIDPYADPVAARGGRLRRRAAQRHRRPGTQERRRHPRRPATTSPSPPRSWPPWPCAPTWPTCATAWAASSSAPATRADGPVKRPVEPITAEDLNVAGAMTVLLKDAIMPNLMQTLAGSPPLSTAAPLPTSPRATAPSSPTRSPSSWPTMWSPSPALAPTVAWKSS